MKVGFIGLGNMGKAMASNLLQAGHTVRVWNRSKAATAMLAERGAIVVDAPADAAYAEVLLTALSDDDANRAVLLEMGTLQHLPEGAIHLNTSTISVAFARRLAELHEQHGTGYVAAPVLSRVDIAAAGRQHILVAGRRDLVDRVEPLLDVLGQRTWYFGPRPEQANVVKLAMNFLIASAIEAMGEAAALATGHGIAKTVLLDLAVSTLFTSPIYNTYGNLIAHDHYEPAVFKLALGLKDMRLILEAADAVNVPLPFASVLKDNHLDSLAHGQGQLDWAALAEVAARRAAQKP